MFPGASILQRKHGEIAARLNIQPAGRVLKLWAPFTTTTARPSRRGGDIHRPAGQTQGGTPKTFAPPRPRLVGRLEQNPAQESAQEQRHGTIGEGRASGPDSAQGMTAQRWRGNHAGILQQERTFKHRARRHPPKDKANTGGESRRNPVRLPPRLRPGASPR